MLILDSLLAAWRLLLDASIYVIGGIVAGGLLKVFLPADFIVRHLGRGRFGPVFKAALLGIPLPLCSCGVLPAAAALKEQGANKGATAAFLVATPESGLDSIATSWALLDPLLTVARPVAAFFTAMLAGIGENLIDPPPEPPEQMAVRAAEPIAAGCACETAPPARDAAPGKTLAGKVADGLRYAFRELWGDLAGWFLLGILLAGVITALLPEDGLSRWLGGGVPAMLLMLAVGIPIYICATASTPIAASLILKGVSPGTALVFLLAGPATNVASLTILARLLGKKATLRYLAAVSLGSLLCGLALDWVYFRTGMEAAAAIGTAAEWVPEPVQTVAAVLLLLLSVEPIWRAVERRRRNKEGISPVGCSCPEDDCPTAPAVMPPFPAAKSDDCGCGCTCRK
ncbi:MAG: SO_0444 family Cu/Zn efflux transporter [Thermodesulfobacteriota bacterium]